MVKSDRNGNIDADVDALFQLPLAEFTGARNELAARLKKAGRGNDANLVKILSKPSISAWAVNQLYWNYRDEFDRLQVAGQRLRQLQTSGLAGKVTNVRASLEERRDALSHLADLATELLTDAGHSPTQDTIRRITSTLEAISSQAHLADGPTPGRLTQDVDLPGFESLATFMSGAATARRAEDVKRVAASPKSEKVAKEKTEVDTQKKRKLEEARQVRIAAAKDSLQDAKKLLTEWRAKIQKLETAQKKLSSETKTAVTEMKLAERELRTAEVRFKKAKFLADEVSRRAESITAEVQEARSTVDEAKRDVDKRSKELESLFRESF